MTKLTYEECEKIHIDNFMNDFKNLLSKYKAVYKPFGVTTSSSCPQIMFLGIPDGKGDTYMSAVTFDLPETSGVRWSDDQINL